MKQLSILFRGTLGFPFPISGAFALCLLLLASCGGDDSSDEGYAAIESASFTFDETTPANNAVRVIANTGWQVFWTPESAAVRVEPASGSGNGVFYVRDMPKGASVQGKYPLIPTLWMIFEDSTFAFRSGDKHLSRMIYGK